MKNGIITLLSTLLAAASLSLAAAPVGYSINSDSGSDNHDGLYRIDLGTGEETRIGTVQALLVPKLDVEGLAFSPDGTLYGVDDETLKLFPIDMGNAVIDHNLEVEIAGLTYGNNDFGMTFACDGDLYVTSVAKQSLYRMGMDGQVTPVGPEGSLGVNISSLAALGNPVRLFGLGNGGAGASSKSNANLYEINVETGTATLIGALGSAVGPYAESGLAFDDSGKLWGITDRRPLFLPSQTMEIDIDTGLASNVRNTSEEGFESLAIAAPGNCNLTRDDNSLQGSSIHAPVPTMNVWTLALLSLLAAVTGLVYIRRL